MDPSKYSIKRPEIIIPVSKDSPTSATPPREAPTKETTRETGKPAAASSSKEASEVVSKEQSEFDEIMLAIQEGSLEVKEQSLLLRCSLLSTTFRSRRKNDLCDEKTKRFD